jgi:hypothetical protein
MSNALIAPESLNSDAGVLAYLRFLSENGGKKAMFQLSRYNPHTHERDMLREWLMPTGARITNDGYGPSLHEAPRGETEQLRAIRSYHAARLERFERDEHKLDLTIRGFGPGFSWNAELYGPPKLNAELGLAILRKLVARERRLIAVIDSKLPAPKKLDRADSMGYSDDPRFQQGN